MRIEFLESLPRKLLLAHVHSRKLRRVRRGQLRKVYQPLHTTQRVLFCGHTQGMRRLAAMGALTLLATLGALSPLPAHADIEQSIYDTPTTAPYTYDGGWNQELGTGLAGTLSEIDFKIDWQAPADFITERMGLGLLTCGDATYSSCSGNFQTNIDFASPSGTTTIAFKDLSAGLVNGFVFDPTKFYQMSVFRLFAPNFHTDETFKVLGTATDTYPGGGTGAPGLADLAFTVKGISPAASSTGVSNVLFLPGIEGSRLYEGSDNKLWEPDFQSHDIQDLYSNSVGSSIGQDIYVKEGDIIDSIPTQGNVYGPLKQDLDSLQQQGKIGEWEPIAYDWREPIDQILTTGRDINGRIYYSGPNAATSTGYIIQELRKLASQSPSHKVTIVAHSNGGLIAKRLTQILGDQESSKLIDKIILVAVPQVGTPQAIASALHGDDQDLAFGLLLNKNGARAFASTTPMTYDLLPSASYFTQVDNPVVSFDPALIEWVAKYGSIIHSQTTMDTFLSDSFGRVNALTGDIDQPVKLDPGTSLIAMGNQLHTNIDAWTPPSGVQVIQIAGWGIDTTISGLTYIPKSGGGIEPVQNTNVDGDGTVPVPSALWIPSGPQVSNYWVNLKQFNSDSWLQTLFSPRNHGTIFDVKSLRDFVSDIIASKTTATSTYPYISDSSPSSNSIRLHYVLRSPLTIDFYDNQGRHTGISTTTGSVEEHIPGIYYSEIGDVKTITTDTNVPVHVYMRGYASSTFTLSIDQYAGDTRTASTTFADIPVSTTTTATLNINSDISSISPLVVDENGDGKPDYTLTPKANATVTIPHDITPPEALLSFDSKTAKPTITRLDDRSGTSSSMTLPTSIVSYQVYDDASNTLKVFISKDVQQSGLSTVSISGLSYNNGSKVIANATSTYYELQSGGKPVLLLAHLKTSSTNILTFYSAFTNKTLIMSAIAKDDNTDPSLLVNTLVSKPRTAIKQYSGLIIPYLFTANGKINVSY